MDVERKQKPDFSGEYVLNQLASVLEGGAATVQSAILSIEHREPMVRCKAAFTFADTSFNYALELVTDGRKVIDGNEPPTTSSAHWDGHALVFTYRTDAPDSIVTMTWRYTLDETRSRLTASEQIRGGGRDQNNVWVFDRHSSS
jgi:hypothetical protein